ncbi:hypothetical protein MJO29_009671 [Puccinia striiformis f. sp. tritici]|nr:hypothetical protein MJO29_009671 [Puccinia striiformis f. sp. tritici]
MTRSLRLSLGLIFLEALDLSPVFFFHSSHLCSSSKNHRATRLGLESWESDSTSDTSELFSASSSSTLPVFIHDISPNQSDNTSNKVKSCAYALSDLYRYLNKVEVQNWRKIKISNHNPILKKLLFFISYSIDSKRLDKFNEEVKEEETHTVPINDDGLDSDLNHHPLSKFLLVKNDNTSQIDPTGPKKNTPMIVETTEFSILLNLTKISMLIMFSRP